MTTPPNSAEITVTTAADTNILVDVFLTDEAANSTARALLSAARQRGPLLICDIVYAELVPNFESRDALDAALRAVGATVSPIDSDIAYTAGLRWGQYRRAGGPRTRILADFLIGAHAIATAETFLSRDHGFYSTYFPELQIA